MLWLRGSVHTSVQGLPAVEPKRSCCHDGVRVLGLPGRCCDLSSGGTVQVLTSIASPLCGQAPCASALAAIHLAYCIAPLFRPGSRHPCAGV